MGQASSVCCTPFTATVLIMDKVLAVLVDGVVREMHAHIILTQHGQNENRYCTSQKTNKQQNTFSLVSNIMCAIKLILTNKLINTLKRSVLKLNHRTE